MNNKTIKRQFKGAIWFIGAFLCLASLVAAPLFNFNPSFSLGWDGNNDLIITETVNQLKELGFGEQLSNKDLAFIINQRRQTGKNLAQLLRTSAIRQKLGLNSQKFKATWYMSNPFDVLPLEIKQAIWDTKVPFKSRTQVWQWCRQNKISNQNRKALYAALIETTPINLWRASRGKPSITKSGKYLEPIVIDHGNNIIEVKNGHIASDPLFIPTNSEVYLIVKIKGEDRIIKVIAADTGGAIKGLHVDLPMHMGPEMEELPHTKFPLFLRNSEVEILSFKRV